MIFSQLLPDSVLIKHENLSSKSKLTLNDYWKGKIIEIRRSRVSVRLGIHNYDISTAWISDFMQKTTLTCVQWFYSPEDVMGAHPTEEIKRWRAWHSLWNTDGGQHVGQVCCHHGSTRALLIPWSGHNRCSNSGGWVCHLYGPMLHKSHHGFCLDRACGCDYNNQWWSTTERSCSILLPVSTISDFWLDHTPTSKQPADTSGIEAPWASE